MVDKRKAGDTPTSRVVVRDRLTACRVPEAGIIWSALFLRDKAIPMGNAGSARTIAVANVISFEGTSD
jgi:hypothetical protein